VDTPLLDPFLASALQPCPDHATAERGCRADPCLDHGCPVRRHMAPKVGCRSGKHATWLTPKADQGGDEGSRPTLPVAGRLPVRGTALFEPTPKKEVAGRPLTFNCLAGSYIPL
jgi:hypothetical protein